MRSSNDGANESKLEKIRANTLSSNKNSEEAFQKKIRNLKYGSSNNGANVASRKSRDEDVQNNREDIIRKKLKNFSVDGDSGDKVQRKDAATVPTASTSTSVGCKLELSTTKPEQTDDRAAAAVAVKPGFSEMTNESFRALRAKAAQKFADAGVSENSVHSDELPERHRRRKSSITRLRRTVAALSSSLGNTVDEDARPTPSNFFRERSLFDNRFNQASFRNVAKFSDLFSIKCTVAITVIIVIIVITVSILLLKNRNVDQLKEHLIMNNVAQESALNNPYMIQSKALDFVMELGVFDEQLYLLAVFIYGIERWSREPPALLENNAEWCQWSWIKCMDNTFVSGIDLSSEYLDGTIVSEIKYLTELEHLNLGRNNLEGTIPTEIGSLKKLKTLDLGSNKLSGKIPTKIGFLTKIEKLILDTNRLTGTIPTQVGHLIKITHINLKGNRLKMRLPTEIGNLVQLKILNLYNNHLTSSIPTEMGNLVNLETLILYANYISGKIPSEMAKLRKMLEFNFCDTEIEGDVPTEWCTNLDNCSDPSRWKGIVKRTANCCEQCD